MPISRACARRRHRTSSPPSKPVTRITLSTDPDRSALMRRVRQKRTGPEEALASMLKEFGVGYRRNVRSLPGSPDFANRKRGWAIFVMGCFWHHHTGCKRATIPKNNRDFWMAKFRANRKRDAAKLRQIRLLGLRPLVAWECAIAASHNRLEPRIYALTHRRHSEGTSSPPA